MINTNDQILPHALKKLMKVSAITFSVVTIKYEFSKMNTAKSKIQYLSIPKCNITAFMFMFQNSFSEEDQVLT